MMEVEARMMVLWQRWTSMTTELAAGGGMNGLFTEPWAGLKNNCERKKSAISDYNGTTGINKSNKHMGLKTEESGYYTVWGRC